MITKRCSAHHHGWSRQNASGIGKWCLIHWPIVMLVALVLVFLMGILGFLQADRDALESEQSDFLDHVYHTLQLFVAESGSVQRPNAWLQIARFFAPLVPAATAIAAFMQVFWEQLRVLTLWRCRGHVVICGLGETGYALAEQYLASGRKVVVIEWDVENDRVIPARALGAIVLNRDALEPNVLRLACVHQARTLIATTGDAAANWEIGRKAAEICSGRQGSLTTFVHIPDPHLVVFLRKHTLTSSNNNTCLEFFSIFDFGASRIVEGFPMDDPGKGFVIIVGLGNMGGALLVRLAHAWYWRHWRDKADGTESPRLKVWVVDREASKKIRLQEARFPTLPKVCQIEAYDTDIGTSDFYDKYLNTLCSFDSARRMLPSAIFVCLGKDSDSLLAALEMDSRLQREGIALVTTVWLTGLGGLAHFAKNQQAEDSRVRLFGLLDSVCRPEVFETQLVETLARAFHEEYLENEKRAGRYRPRSLSDPDGRESHLAWKDLPERFKESNRRVARHVSVKLDRIGCALTPRTNWEAELFRFTEAEKDTLATLEHERWRQEDASPDHRLKDIPWENLDPDEKKKTLAQIGALPVILARAGFDIVRIQHAGRWEMD